MTATRARLERLLWVATGSGVLGLALELRGRTAAVEADVQPATIALPAPGLWSPDSLVAWTDRIADAPPFRLDRRAALPAVSVMTAPGPPSLVTPASPRPPLVVQGIVGQRGRWEAVLGGVPGQATGVLVQVGDSLVGGLYVKRIGADTVVVSARDTTWTLVVRQTWP